MVDLNQVTIQKKCGQNQWKSQYSGAKSEGYRFLAVRVCFIFKSNCDLQIMGNTGMFTYPPDVVLLLTLDYQTSKFQYSFSESKNGIIYDEFKLLLGMQDSRAAMTCDVILVYRTWELSYG